MAKAKIAPANTAGQDRAKELTVEFGRNLLDDAGRHAVRIGEKEATAAIIEKTAERLYQSHASRKQQAQAAIGGVVVGVGLSAATSVMLTDKPSIFWIVVTLVISSIGSTLMTLGLVRRDF